MCSQDSPCDEIKNESEEKAIPKAMSSASEVSDRNSDEEKRETPRKRVASGDETWISHPLVENLLLGQVANMDELDDM